MPSLYYFYPIYFHSILSTPHYNELNDNKRKILSWTKLTYYSANGMKNENENVHKYIPRYIDQTENNIL